MPKGCFLKNLKQSSIDLLQPRPGFFEPGGVNSWRAPPIRRITPGMPGSIRGEFLGKFLKVAERYAELVRDATDARQVEIRGNRFGREDSLSHD